MKKIYMYKNQKGFGSLEGLLILAIVGMLAFVGWFVWSSNSKAQKSLNNADQSNSVGVSLKKKPPSNITSEPTKDSSTPSASGPSRPDPVVGYLEVKEWGIKIPLGKNTADLTYRLESYKGIANVIGHFRTKKMDTLWPGCEANTVLFESGKANDIYAGHIDDGSNPTFKEVFDKGAVTYTKSSHIGDRYFIKGPPGASCSDKEGGDPQEEEIGVGIASSLSYIEAL